MEVFLTYLIGNAESLRTCFFFIGVFLISLMLMVEPAFERKNFFILVSIIVFFFILSNLIPDSETCVEMLNAMKS